MDEQRRPQRRIVGRQEPRIEVSIGCIEVAPPDLGAGEGQLDRAVRGRTGEGGRRLERRDRAAVIAEPRSEATDRRVEPDDVGVAEGERGFVVTDRLAIREDRRGPVTRVAKRDRRLGVPTAVTLVLGDLD